MKALRYYGQRDIRFEDIPVPDCDAKQVKVKVTDVGLCQTQVNEFIEGPFIINDQPHVRTGKHSPFVVGHEYGGVVDAIGDGVSDKSLLGKQVAILPLSPCMECDYCKKGKYNNCETMAYYGLLGEHGGFAEYSVVNEENVIPVEKKELLTFIEPILCGINCGLKLKRMEEVEKILILGAGALGISAASVLQDYFGYQVYVNDVFENRMSKAEQAGFKIVGKSDLKREYDVVLDFAGSDTTSKTVAFDEGFNYLKRDGSFVSVGTYFHPIPIVPCNLTFNEHHIISSFSYSGACVSLLEEVLGSLRTDFSLFIDRIPFEDVIEGGYYRAEVDRDSFTRLVIDI